jgi:hypothetical protein
MKEQPKYIPTNQEIEITETLASGITLLTHVTADPITTLLSAIGLGLAAFPQENWQEYLDLHQGSCPRPGCDCHVLMEKAIPILNELRTEALEAHPLPTTNETAQA